jgi:hypothetical protein
MQLSRRGLFASGVGAVGVAALSSFEPLGAAGTGTPPSGPYIWALDTSELLVPHATWTPVTYNLLACNTTGARLEPDLATWIFPTASAAGIWGIIFEIAWDNATGPSGEPIHPRTHRKLARILQQDVGASPVDGIAYSIASTEVTYHADLAQLDGRAVLADGAKGYQQQQVAVQSGVGRTGPDQRMWVEVYQDSGEPLMCRFDGTDTPQTATRPRIVGIQAPSLMIAKFLDI